MTPTYTVDDNYVWLGGRPVVVVRGKLSTSWARQADSSASCNRNGEAQACGFYFPVTDHIGKPVLMLDSSRRVTGSADRDPFGHANRVTLDAETAHPASCPSGTWISTLADFSQPVGGTANPNTTARFRVLFNLVDTYSSNSNFAQIVDGDTSAVLQSSIGGPHAGQIWSSWQTPSAGHVQVQYSNTGVSGQTCSNLQGIVMEGYEYQRYQSTATPFWTPLRFPGQYYDFETDLAQNWNRFYELATGRYLQPEPMLQNASYVKQAMTEGNGMPVYAFASNNPNAFIDLDGRSPRKQLEWKIRSCKQAEYQTCAERCGAHGVRRCEVKQTSMIDRIIDKDETTFIEYVWKDGTPTCLCNDDDPPRCGDTCKKVLVFSAVLGTLVWICATGTPPPFPVP